jgi:hypothetical protein
MKVYKIQINICEACLKGIGQECHTPGCANFLKDVPENGYSEYQYEIIEDVK